MKNEKSDEITLESWKSECAELEAQMKEDSDELRRALDEFRDNPDIDPEMKKVALEAGERMLEADTWLHEMNEFTTDVVAKCDRMIAKCKELERENETDEEDAK